MTKCERTYVKSLEIGELAAEHWASKGRHARRRFWKLAVRERRHDPPIRRAGRTSLRRAAAAALLTCTVIVTGPACDDDKGKGDAAEAKFQVAQAEARAAQAEQATQVERSKREQAEASLRKAEQGRAFWLAASAIGTVAALVIGTGMGSKTRSDLQKQRHDGNGQYAISERLQERV